MMKISACYIVKNEEKNLAHSLDSLLAYVDEIIVVDTGSTDGTTQIARAYGAQMFFYSWRDDFSAPRNYALDRANGDWIVFLDADEYFVGPENIRSIIAEIDQKHPEADAVVLHRMEIDPSRHEGIASRSIVLRIFRHRPYLRYQGIIHENIHHVGGELQLYFEKRLILHHTGYFQEIVQEKILRDLRLLNKDMEKHGEGPQHYMYLADCYFGLKDYAKALAYAKKSIASPVYAIASRGKMYHRVIESMRKLNTPLPDQLTFSEQAIQALPELPEFYAEQGMILCGMARLKDARERFLQAIAIYEQGTAPAIEASYFNNDVASKVYCRLGEIENLAQRKAKAEEYFQKALAENPDNETCKKIYQDFIKSKK